MTDFEGSIVLITGASSGIGAGFARSLHSKGASLILVARRVERLLELQNQFNSERAGSCEIISADLSRAQSTQDCLGLNELIEVLQNREIDLFVSNAGAGTFGEFEHLNMESEINLINLNVIASTSLIHALIPKLKKRRFKTKKRSGIIILSSVAAIAPIPLMSTYSATKAFNYAQGLSLNKELAPSGIHVLVVCPGPVRTEFGKVAQVPGGFGGPHDAIETIVERSLAAFLRGKTKVFPGFISFLAGTLTNILPYRIVGAVIYRSLKTKLLNSTKN